MQSKMEQRSTNGESESGNSGEADGENSAEGERTTGKGHSYEKNKSKKGQIEGARHSGEVMRTRHSASTKVTSTDATESTRAVYSRSSAIA